MRACKVCLKSGSKGFYRMKKDWLSPLDLPQEFVIKDTTFICFRHFKKDDFYFIFEGGEKMRLKKYAIPTKEEITKESDIPQFNKGNGTTKTTTTAESSSNLAADQNITSTKSFFRVSMGARKIPISLKHNGKEKHFQILETKMVQDLYMEIKRIGKCKAPFVISTIQNPEVLLKNAKTTELKTLNLPSENAVYFRCFDKECQTKFNSEMLVSSKSTEELLMEAKEKIKELISENQELKQQNHNLKEQESNWKRQVHDAKALQRLWKSKIKLKDIRIEKMELQLEKARKKLKNNSSSEPNFESLNHIPCASDKSPPKTMETSENNVNKHLTTLSDGGEEENNSKIENVQKKFREIDSSHFDAEIIDIDENEVVQELERDEKNSVKSNYYNPTNDLTCQTCLKTFKNIYESRKHQKIVENPGNIPIPDGSIGNHQCDFCDQTFLSNDYLCSHIKKTHEMIF